MREPTLRQLRTFLSVIEQGSVTEAARALGLTQPAASQQLRELERITGVRLLERAGGQALPTPAGQALLEPARRAQAAAEDALAATAPHRNGETALVRIGTGATACIFFLPAVLAEARKAMPGLQVTVTIGNTAGLVPRLIAGELDLGLLTLPAEPARGLSVTPLLDDSFLALLPEAMAKGRKHITPPELAALPLIAFEAGSHTRALGDAWFRAAGLAPAPAMALGSVEAIKPLVGAGLGAALLPAMALRPPPPGTRALALKPALSRQIGYVLRREKIVDRGLRLVLKALEKAAR
ncbi:LysR family transcriptional regulator [Roseomonas sp. 18066]|uniref:LysR family transcriptional regulator n=1 Tax=Roseomonas sp. 18066 TaxID=2681412 RepID=UPI001359238A|nr:LysR family transcriptional regulator [Roseomonas sp. 18066]